jgi:hypothetical protein
MSAIMRNWVSAMPVIIYQIFPPVSGNSMWREIQMSTFTDCGGKYTGQTGGSFQKNIFSLSNIEIQIQICKTPTWCWTFIWPCAKHHRHLHFVKKGKLMYCLEKCYIYSETIINTEIKEESTREVNKVYGAAIQHENYRCRTWIRCMPSETFMLQAHPNSPQVLIPPPSSHNYDTTTYHNTKILSEHTTYKYFYYVN